MKTLFVLVSCTGLGILLAYNITFIISEIFHFPMIYRKDLAGKRYREFNAGKSLSIWRLLSIPIIGGLFVLAVFFIPS